MKIKSWSLGMLTIFTRYIKEHIPKLPRAAILLVQAFSLRLHDEDPTFIRRFLQRHLAVKAVYKEPHQLPAASMSGVSVSLLSVKGLHLASPSSFSLGRACCLHYTIPKLREGPLIQTNACFGCRDTTKESRSPVTCLIFYYSRGRNPNKI